MNSHCLQLNARTLLNSLLDNAPDKTKVQKMVLDWRNMDLSNVIYVSFDVFLLAMRQA